MNRAALAYLPPQDLDAERAVLGAMMSPGATGAAVCEEVRALLTDEAFYGPAHSQVFGGILGLHTSGVPTDIVTLTGALRDAGMLEHVGGTINGIPSQGAAYITELFTFTPYVTNVQAYIAIVREKWMLRQMMDICATAMRRCAEEQDDPLGILNDLQSRTVDIGQLSTVNDPVIAIGDVIPEVIEQIEATFRNRGNPMGITSGFNDLDRITGGWMPGRVHIIAARPAMGKTSLATSFAEHAAVDCVEKKVATLIFSVEMTANEIAEVMLLRRAEVTLTKLRTGMYTKEERLAVDEQARQLTASGLWIDGTAALSVFEFRARARRAIVGRGVKLIIVDYLQLMRSTSKRAQGNRELEIAEIMQALIDTAKEMQVAIIALAQLNRDTEKRSIEGIPQLSDLRESGSIESGAHFVGLLYRPSYYFNTDDKIRIQAEKREMSEEAFKSHAELIIAKHRRGPVGTVPLRFVKEFARFESEDPSRPLYSNNPEKRQRK